MLYLSRVMHQGSRHTTRLSLKWRLCDATYQASFCHMTIIGPILTTMAELQTLNWKSRYTNDKQSGIFSRIKKCTSCYQQWHAKKTLLPDLN